VIAALDPFTPLAFPRGAPMRNRLALAPLTNLQSHDDGCISDDELAWLARRADGGFGMVMTCAAAVHPLGKGFPRQMGIHADAHRAGLERLAAALRVAGSISAVQLQHSGARAPRDLIDGQPVGATDDAQRGVRGLSTGEVEQAVEDFITAGLRARDAGFDGVEIHGAHGYLPCQFLDVKRNQRTDRYGGDADGRARMLNEIIIGLRGRAGQDFQIGVRLSPERYGVAFAEMRMLAQKLMGGGLIDYCDISCWDAFKRPEDPDFQDRDLIGWYADLDRGAARLGVAGKLTSAASVRDCFARGVDFVLLGRGAILHHDFPTLMAADPDFRSASLPVSRAHLARESLGRHFIDYMATWQGFVAEQQEQA